MKVSPSGEIQVTGLIPGHADSEKEDSRECGGGCFGFDSLHREWSRGDHPRLQVCPLPLQGPPQLTLSPWTSEWTVSVPVTGPGASILQSHGCTWRKWDFHSGPMVCPMTSPPSKSDPSSLCLPVSSSQCPSLTHGRHPQALSPTLTCEPGNPIWFNQRPPVLSRVPDPQILSPGRQVNFLTPRKF